MALLHHERWLQAGIRAAALGIFLCVVLTWRACHIASGSAVGAGRLAMQAERQASVVDVSEGGVRVPAVP